MALEYTSDASHSTEVYVMEVKRKPDIILIHMINPEIQFHA